MSTNRYGYIGAGPTNHSKMRVFDNEDVYNLLDD